MSVVKNAFITKVIHTYLILIFFWGRHFFHIMSSLIVFIIAQREYRGTRLIGESPLRILFIDTFFFTSLYYNKDYIGSTNLGKQLVYIHVSYIQGSRYYEIDLIFEVEASEGSSEKERG